MTTIIKSVSVLLTGLIILIIAFYWYEIRPSQIADQCNQNAIDSVERVFSKANGDDEFELYDYFYTTCARRNGLSL